MIALNAQFIAWAAEDRSFTAIQISILVGPVSNVILLLVSLAVTPLLRRTVGGASVGLYKAVSIGLPLVAVMVDFVVIFAMPLHGS